MESRWNRVASASNQVEISVIECKMGGIKRKVVEVKQKLVEPNGNYSQYNNFQDLNSFYHRAL